MNTAEIGIRRREILCWIGILSIALALRWGYSWMHPELGRDASLYLLNSNDLHSNYDVAAYGSQPPLLVFLLSLLFFLPFSPELSSMVAMQLCGVGFVVAWYWAGREIFPEKRQAFWLMLLAALAPYPIALMADPLRESLAYPLAVVVMTLCLRAFRKPGWCIAIAAGAICGVGMTCRYEFFEWLPVLAGSLAAASWRRRLSWPVAIGMMATGGVIAISVFLLIYYLLGFELLPIILRYYGLFRSRI